MPAPLFDANIQCETRQRPAATAWSSPPRLAWGVPPCGRKAWLCVDFRARPWIGHAQAHRHSPGRRWCQSPGTCDCRSVHEGVIAESVPKHTL